MSSALNTLFPLAEDTTPYRKLDVDGVGRGDAGRAGAGDRQRRGAARALQAGLHRHQPPACGPGHLAQLAKILDDPEATSNDKFVAYDLLKNANIAAGGVLPMCQDTGTAIVMGKKGRLVWTDGGDEDALADGIRDAYFERNLRYSQLAPLSMFEEANTRNNLPAEINLYAEGDDAYKFLFVAKGGGSANKTFLYQGTPSLLTKDRLMAFLKEKILTLGTSACPPYHLAIVIGGTSAELVMKTVKLASTRYLDGLPTQGSAAGHAFRDLAMEEEVHKLTQSLGVGAQFGGKYFCHDVRVIRLPRHGASCRSGSAFPARRTGRRWARSRATASSSSSWRPTRRAIMPEVQDEHLGGDVVEIDLTRPMSEIRAELAASRSAPASSLNGPMIVARDLAHAKIRERLERGRADAGLFQGPPRLLRRARPRRRRATPRARSDRPPRGAWTASSTSSRRRAARW